MQPSKYQAVILDWLKNGSGHGCCNAVAGSGKSTTLRLGAQALQESGLSPSEIKIIVFGKANSLDLIKKFGAEWKESISTLHSAGFSLLKQELGIKSSREANVSSAKYKQIAQDLGLIGKRGNPIGTLKGEDALDNDRDFLKLIDLVRLTNQFPTAEAVRDICQHFEIPDVWEFSVVASAIAECLRSGERKARAKESFDFTDQIWLPVKWQLGKERWFKPYRFVLVDECQDLNAAQLELSLMLAGGSGRILAVGDPRQAIMGFAGADNRSYQKIVERLQAKELPLSICYRCPKTHIDLVKQNFPQVPLEASESAADGHIEAIAEADLWDAQRHCRLVRGDMVLSRKTAPLVSLCIKLIARGIAATVKGKAIGEQVKGDLEEIGKMPGFQYENFNAAVSAYRQAKVIRYRRLDNEEQLTEALNDKLEALQTIYKSQPQSSCLQHLADYIDSLFSDEHSPITLSTCHRAKGLEGDRIFILKPEDMPMTWRNQLDWQKEQEDNLLYVALTRSKAELFVVGKPNWLPQEEEPEPEQEIPLEPRPKKSLLPDDWGGLEGDLINLLSGGDDYSEDEDEEPSERELYEEMERVAQEDLLPMMAEIFNGDPELETVNISSDSLEMKIEYVSGGEQYTSNWARFRVEGLEKWAVRSNLPEDIQGKQNNYFGYTCLETPEETTFSILEQSGNKRSIRRFNFYICVTSNNDYAEVTASHSRGRCKGNFKVVCVGEGKAKASKLMEWWTKSEDHSLEFAMHCAAHINKRSLKELPPLSPRTEEEVIADAPQDAPSASNHTLTDSYAQLEQEIKEYFRTDGLEEPKLTQAYEGVMKVASGTMGRNDIDERLEIFFSPTHRPAVKRFAIRLCDLREAELKTQSAEQQAIETHLEVQREALGMNAEDYEFEGEVRITPDQILVKGKYHNSKTYTYPRSAGIPDWASGLPVLYYPGCKPEPAQKTVNIFSTKTVIPQGGQRFTIAPMIEPETVNELQSETAETPETQRKQWLNLGLITLNAGTQSRGAIHQATINDYTEQMKDGRWQWEREPLPILFSDGQNFYPGDGHHRIMAADAAGTEEIFVEIRPGTLREAVFYSTSANKYHGLPRTNADKRNQVEILLRDEEWQKLSDRSIAEHCGVSAPLVGKIRAELTQSGTVNISTERVDRKGRKIETVNIGTKPKEKKQQGREQTQESIPGVPQEQLEKAFDKYQELSNSSGAVQESTVPAAGNNGVKLLETTQDPPLQQKMEALISVAENQINLLSEKVGAKTIAEIALDLCTLEEIRELHADLSASLEALGEEN